MFTRDGVVYRRVNRSHGPHYDRLMTSGLYRELTGQGLLIPHEEVHQRWAQDTEAYRILQPVPVPFISYPYEWCFSALKDAALTTLKIQRLALQYGMIMQDASAFNIQFFRGRPVLIDTLSLHQHVPGEPWMAYRQFCEHFLAPLLLMSRCDARLSRLFMVHLDGIPLDLARKLLPRRTWLRWPLWLHVYLHAKGQQWFAARSAAGGLHRTVSRASLLGLVESLEEAVRELQWEPAETGWATYTWACSYEQKAYEEKLRLTGEYLDLVRPAVVWDLGSNRGEFSRLAATKANAVLSLDADPVCVERSYRQIKAEGDRKILPLVMDLTNPSAAIGWNHAERLSLADRGGADAVMALGLLHHLAIGNHVSFSQLAQFLSRLGRTLILEFIPKDDPMVQRLLAHRVDVFGGYHRDGFDAAFRRRFHVRRVDPIQGSQRVLFLFERRDDVE